MKRVKASKKNEIINKSKKNRTEIIPASVSFIDKKEYIGIFGIVILFLVIASSHLGKFFTTDETAWFYEWIQKYWNGMLTQNFSDTNFSSYPGAFHSFITGITNIFLDQKEYMTYDKVETYLFWWRFPILFFNAISLILIYQLLRNFFDTAQSLAIVFLTAFSPIIFGMSRIVNSDSVLWNTTLISVLSFLILFKHQKNKYILLSGIFMGFALASKYNAIIIFLYQLVIFPLQYFYGKADKTKLKSLFFQMILIWLTALIVFSLLYPAAIVSSRLYWQRIFRYFITNPLFLALFAFLLIDIFILKSKVLEFFKTKVNIKFYLYRVLPILFLVLLIGTASMKFLNIEPHSWQATSEQWKMPFFKSFLENIYGFLYSTQIPVLVGIIVFAIISLFRKNIKRDFSIPVYMIILLLIFILGSSLQGVKVGHRYIIILYPFSAIIAVWAFSQFKKASVYIFLLIALLSLVDIASLYPKHYVLYRNTNYLKGQNKYYWSLGVYDLAQKLNKVEGVEKLSVLSDRPGFSLFFKGKTTLMTGMTTAEYIKKFDYLYLSEAGYRQNYINQPLEDYYEIPLKNYKFHVGNEQIGWAAIVKVDKNKKEVKIDNTFDPKFYIDLEKNWTISLWTQQIERDAGHIIYIGKNFEKGIEFYVKSNKFFVKYSEKNDLTIENIDSTKLNNIIWSHKNISDKQYVSLWLNGNKILEKRIDTIKIRKPKFFISTNYKGKIEDIRIYTFNLSKKQIKLIYNKGINSETTLEVDGEKFIPIQRFAKKETK